jgi:hypothetical protein
VYETLGIAGFVCIRRHKRQCGAERSINHLNPNVLYTMLATVNHSFFVVLNKYSIPILNPIDILSSGIFL